MVDTGKRIKIRDPSMYEFLKSVALPTNLFVRHGVIPPQTTRTTSYTRRSLTLPIFQRESFSPRVIRNEARNGTRVPMNPAISNP